MTLKRRAGKIDARTTYFIEEENGSCNVKIWKGDDVLRFNSIPQHNITSILTRLREPVNETCADFYDRE